MKTVIISSLLVFLTVTMHAQSRFEEEGDDKQSQTQTQPQQDENAQTQTSTPARQKGDFWQRTRFGGNLGAGFSNGFTYVNVSPRMYYLATEKLWLGAGLTFIWSKNDYNPPPYDEQFVYGANFSAQYMLFGPIFLQGEYEPLSYERARYNSITGEFTQEERVWVHGLLLGGGISQNVGRGMFFVSVLYNVTWTNEFDSYYTSPWIFRVGFGI